MCAVCRIGLDIAKNVFQAHGCDKSGKTVFSRKIQRKGVLLFFVNFPPCLVALEACSGAHHWGRELMKLGHDVRLVPPRTVKPFVLNNKTDAADAQAICEVAGRPSTKFVSVKTVEQQDMAAWHRIRELAVKERTALVNQARALLHEQGVIIPQGITHVRRHLPRIIEDENVHLSLAARDYLSELWSELIAKDERIKKYEERIVRVATTNEDCKRLQTIPGIGPLTATAIVAHVGKGEHFKNGRQFAACMGLTPREHSSGGKQKLLGISKRGNNHIRKLLIQGARVVVRYGATPNIGEGDTPSTWLHNLIDRRGKFVAAVAQANKTARMAWAVLARGEVYRQVA